jgi:hypothetical protein
MAGIEQAFKDFVKRVSEKENQDQVSGERGYQYGGGAIGYNHGGRINYSSGSGYPPVEMPNPYEPQNEFGDKQTGEKRIPIMQGIMQGHNYQNTMPIYQMQEPYPNYQNIPNQYNQNQPYYQQGLADGGGVETLFRPRYANGGTEPSFYDYFSSADKTKPISYGDKTYNPISSYQGKDYGIGLNRWTAKPMYASNFNPNNRFDLYGNVDPYLPFGYEGNAFYLNELPEDFFSTGMSTPTTTEIPTVDPFSLSYDPNDPEAFVKFENAYDKSRGWEGSHNPAQTKDLMDAYNQWKDQSSNIPTIDPFSGQQVTIQDLIDINKEMSAKAPPGYGFSEEGLRKNADDDAARLQSMMEAFNSGFYNNAPTVDPFSGQQVSAQDQAAFTQPQQQQPSSAEQFIAQRQFQSEAEAAARNGTPFTKTLQDYLSPVAGATYGKSVLDAFNQIGLTPAKQMLVNQALNSPSGIVNALLGEVGGGFRPTPGGVGLGEYIGQGLKSLGQAATLNTANLGVNPAVGGGTLGSRVLGNLIGGPAMFATALLNPTTMGNAELTPAMRSQQEAAARVPMKMKSGGYVNTDLTRTIPPVRGPNPQGVETLFKRRYN